MSANETLIMSGANDEASDEEMDEEELLPMEDIGSPMRESVLFLTEVSANAKNALVDMPELETVQTELSEEKQGLLESHFAFVGTTDKTSTPHVQDATEKDAKVTLSVPEIVYTQASRQGSIDEGESTKVDETTDKKSTPHVQDANESKIQEDTNKTNCSAITIDPTIKALDSHINKTEILESKSLMKDDAKTSTHVQDATEDVVDAKSSDRLRDPLSIVPKHDNVTPTGTSIGSTAKSDQNPEEHQNEIPNHDKNEVSKITNENESPIEPLIDSTCINIPEILPKIATTGDTSNDTSNVCISLHATTKTSSGEASKDIFVENSLHDSPTMKNEETKTSTPDVQDATEDVEKIHQASDSIVTDANQCETEQNVEVLQGQHQIVDTVLDNKTKSNVNLEINPVQETTTTDTFSTKQKDSMPNENILIKGENEKQKVVSKPTTEQKSDNKSLWGQQSYLALTKLGMGNKDSKSSKMVSDEEIATTKENSDTMINVNATCSKITHPDQDMTDAKSDMQKMSHEKVENIDVAIVSNLCKNDPIVVDDSDVTNDDKLIVAKIDHDAFAAPVQNTVRVCFSFHEIVYFIFKIDGF